MADETRKKGKYVIHEENLVEFLTLLKGVLDSGYISHRRTKVVEVNSESWSNDETEGLYYFDIAHGLENQHVDVRGYTLTTPADSLALAIRVIDENIVRIFSKGNDSAVLILYELESSIKANLRIDSDYSQPSSQSLWTSRITKDYIDDRIPVMVSDYFSSNDILDNELFMNKVTSSVIDSIDVYSTIREYTDDKFDKINTDITKIKQTITIIQAKLPSMTDIENKVNDTIDNKVTNLNLATIDDLNDRISGIEAVAKKYTDDSINKINNNITDITTSLKTNYATKEDLTDVVNGINTKLDDYVTSASLDTTLEGYAKKSDIEGLIPGDYVTKTELDDFHTALLAEVDYKIQNFEAVRAMTQNDINNAIDSVLH